MPISDNLQSAVYYYKDGFNSDIITEPEFNEDYIRLEASGKSGHVYNTHQNNGNEIAEDFYYFALDELRHAKFWLDMLEIKEDEDYELYKEQWDELNSLVHEERRGEVHEH